MEYISYIAGSADKNHEELGLSMREWKNASGSCSLKCVWSASVSKYVVIQTLEGLRIKLGEKVNGI